MDHLFGFGDGRLLLRTAAEAVQSTILTGRLPGRNDADESSNNITIEQAVLRRLSLGFVEDKLCHVRRCWNGRTRVGYAETKKTRT